MYKEIKNLTSNASVYVLSGFINAAVPLILIPLLTRFLSPSEYGIVGFFMLILTGFSMISALGVEGAATRKYFDSDISNLKISEFVGTCLYIIIFTVLALLLVSFFFSQYTPIFIGLDLFWVLSAVIAGGCSMIIQLASGQAQVREKPLIFSFIQILSGITNLSISIILVVSFQLGAEGRMMGILLSFLLMLLISLSILKYFNWIIFRYRYKYLREALDFGLPLLPHSISLFILAMADRYLIGLFLDFDDLGIYVLAMQLAAIFGIFFTSFHNAFTPWLYKNLKKNDPTIQKNIVLFTYSYFILFIFLGLLGVLISPYAIELIADPKYFSAKDLMGFLIFSQIFTGFYLMVVGYLLYEKRTKLLSSITIFSATLNILMFFIFISSFGLKGVALASLIAMFVRFILVWFYSNKVHKMPWSLYYQGARS